MEGIDLVRRAFSIRLVAVLLSAAALGVPSAAPAGTLPSGFDDSLVASVAAPTALAFTPDGRILVASQSGTLHVVRDGTLVATPALDLTSVACSDGEHGLLGIAVDPAFASTHFVYLYYTASVAGGCVNRVSRFVLPDDNVVDPTTEVA